MDYVQMEIKDIRVSRLKDYVAENEGAAAIARQHPEIDASYISQLINGHRPFGEKSARKLEAILGLSKNYFDTNDQNYKKSDRLSALMKVAQELPDYAIDEVIGDALRKAELIARAQSEKNGTDKK